MRRRLLGGFRREGGGRQGGRGVFWFVQNMSVHCSCKNTMVNNNCMPATLIGLLQQSTTEAFYRMLEPGYRRNVRVR